VESRSRCSRYARIGALAALAGVTFAPTPALATPAPGDADPVDSTVSANTGAATYRIPIDVPPGTAGLAPQLALVYSSHAGDGPFGVGWRLHLGEIRCTTTQRGVPDPNTCPRYELDGQLLTPETTAGRYHTFIESFRKVEYVSATEDWKVTSPDGTILRYGSTEVSRIPANGATARWLLSEVTDAFGNAISVAYSADPTTSPDLSPDSGTAYPTLITYAGGMRTVHFVYEPRPDPLHDFAGGIERTTTRRLKEIQVKTDSQLVHKRTFGYDGLAGTSYTTERSRLAWTQLVGSDGTSTLPRQEFRYTDHGLDGNQWGVDDPAWHLPSPETQLGDVDGDGLLDQIAPGAVRINTSTGWATDTDWTASLARATSPLLELRATLVYPDAAQATTEGTPYRQASRGVSTASVAIVDPANQLDSPYWSYLSAYYTVWAVTPPAWSSLVRVTSGSWLAYPYNNPPITPSVASDPQPAPVEGGVQAQGLGFRVADVDGNGLADLVYSFSISGITRNVTPSGAALAPEDQTYTPGEQVRVVYRNTGAPCPPGAPPNADCGWVRDESLAGGLPPFASVRVESVEQFAIVDPSEARTLNFQCANFDVLALLGFLPGGSPSSAGHSRSIDFCLNYLDYAPEFVDLDGDGHLDLLAIEEQAGGVPGPADFTQLMGNLTSTLSVTRAWLQRPGESPRWVRAQAFDPPFSHRTTDQDSVACTYVPYPSVTPGCPGGRVHETGVRLADLNRDGLTDIVWKDPQYGGYLQSPVQSPTVTTGHATGVLINRGRGDATGSVGSAWCSSHDGCGWAQGYLPEDPLAIIDIYPVPTGYFADLNADGWVDFVYANALAAPARAWLHAPGGTPRWQSAGSVFTPPNDAAILEAGRLGLADVNGDGAADFLVPVAPGGAPTTARAFVSMQPTIPDLLREVRNGQGGTLTLAHERAALQRDAALEGLAADDAAIVADGEATNPGPGSLWQLPVVTSVTVAGPNRTAGTTSYAYAHPRYCAEHRAGLGFRLLERTRPDASKVQELFYQSHGRAGRSSQLSVLDSDGYLVFRQWQTWKEPTGLVPGSILDPEVFLARLTQVRTLRGSFVSPLPGLPGTLIGPEQVRTLTYDDEYGYNFVKEILDQRPTGALRTLRVPYPANKLAWTFGRLSEVREEDTAPSPEILSHASFTWTSEGRLAARTDHVRHRYSADAPADLVTSLDWYENGNLKSHTDPNGHATELCYDGDTTPAWCPSVPGPATHSVLVGLQDPLGKRTTLTPDALRRGLAKEALSGYTDEPGFERDFDVFGRVTEERAIPNGASPFKREEWIYHDDATPPYGETKEYADRAGAGSTNFVRSATVSDGFGGVWKSIEKTPGGWVGTFVYHEPSAGRVRETYPVACADDTCSAFTGATGTATVSTRDILGRAVQVATPDGTSTLSYGIGGRIAPGSGQPSTLLESVRIENAKGDLTRQLVDAERVVWVEECHGALNDPNCESADRTYYAYEPTGELAAIYDPMATAAGTTSDAAHRLVYRFDTLGRSWKIEDPDAGTSTTTFDGVGNILSTTNARSQTTTFTHDPLDRLVTVDQPPGYRDYVRTYRDNERQREKERGLTPTGTEVYAHTFTYDDMGRTARKHLHFPSKNLLLDFAYDELGRTTAITYPDTATVVRYEHAGAYLERVCEVASPSTACPQLSDPNAVFYLKDVAYDALGRRATVETPAGMRTYTYLPSTQRLATDQFTSSTANPLYSRTLSYASDDPGGVGNYDPLGNLLHIAGSSTTNAVDFSASYEFDERNRLASWQKPGVPGVPATPKAYFNHDALGNLTGHAVGSASAVNQEFSGTRPHAVTARTDLDLSYAHDPDGNLLSETGPGGARSFGFDALGRLTCVNTGTGGCNVLSVDYDASGFRIREDGMNSQGVWTTRRYAGELFTLDDTRGDFHIFAFGEPIAYKRKVPVTLRTAGVWALPWIELGPPPPWAVGLFAALGLAGLAFLTIRLEGASGLREHPALRGLALSLAAVLVIPPLPARAGGGGTTVIYRRWILSDHLGSASVVLEADGHVERETVYAAFGAIHQDVGAEGTDTEVFAGHPRESATDLHYMQARWQDPATGSFLSVDPLVASARDPQAVNAYSYARSNPATFVDPTGACPECEGIPYEVLNYFGVASWDFWPGSEFTMQTPESFDVFGGRTRFGSEGSSYRIDPPGIAQTLASASSSGPPASQSGFLNEDLSASDFGTAILEDLILGMPPGELAETAVIAGSFSVLGRALRFLRLGRFLGRGAQAERRVLQGTDKQIGRKFGQHRDPTRPGYRTHQEYRQRAEGIFNDPNARVTRFPAGDPKYPGETHYQVGDELLRLDPGGAFRSLYRVE
jgi:RHS repeat-associated protein